MLGLSVNSADGSNVRCSEGDKVSCLVGLIEGCALGTAEYRSVGESNITLVGLFDGDATLVSEHVPNDEDSENLNSPPMKMKSQILVSIRTVLSLTLHYF